MEKCWHVRKQVGASACPTYLRLRRFSASQKDKINKKAVLQGG